ncbi:tetratricopeptide repeat protein [Chamaesiphon minutus]|uniref:DNA/RNA helicase, superfamily I n=1 Tax=Chamaesiphon minutus (strain ATCC 27169 / PCC 6605) TaxID=1173020 RepID=K9UEA2_CHAP6|nr:tetratricopeptide repeat protein [Chamaesiphon minutus]AFY92968.1 DNA/RNA helicase, superfamily I [Chamaesiphon minutus PCC 6605]
MNLDTVVREKVWKSLKSTDPSFIEEVRQCINKIEKRQFDVGLRVKKLKGTSKIVWEARINRDSRLLFTYKQSNHRNGQTWKFIAIEAVCREHDEVNHHAQIIDRNWWEAEEVRVLGNLDQKFQELSSEDQAEIHLWQAAEIEIQAESTDELLDNTKWLILEPEIIESEQAWQMAIASAADLRLRLTPDESKAIDTYGNMLLSGSAGTGKTTVGLYRLARTLQMNPTAKCLYVGYNPILVKESKEQFKQLWGETFEGLPLKPEFLTIRDLCLKITKDLGEEFKHHLVGYQYFYQRYIKKPESKQYPPALVWDEIRSIIKGANLKAQSGCYLLSQKEYENLGKKRSGAIRAGERHKIYKLAQWYQNRIDREQLADEIDLTRTALRLSKTARYQPYTLIVCDEIQDLTEIQIELLIRLLVQNGQILGAGDMNQMISPSGFRWEDLTTRLYQQNRQWTEKRLDFNFRSTGKLGAFAVELLNLKFKLLSESQSQSEAPINTSGELARLVAASRNDLKQIKLGSGDAILVRTEEQKAELLTDLTTKLIFTIEESKGLEFDTVYLVNFFEYTNSLESTIASSTKQLTRQQPQLRLEFNLLYVAITRARYILNICEPKISDLWKRTELAESLISMSIAEAFSPAQAIAPQDWYLKAIYYRDARLLPQALECATKSGDETLKQEIEVESLLLDLKYYEAAQLLLEIEKYSEAAEILEDLGDWQEAAQAWGWAGNRVRSLECEVKSLKDKNQLESAADKLIEIERYGEAAELLEAAECWDKAVEIWGKLGDEDGRNRCLLRSSINNCVAIEDRSGQNIEAINDYDSERVIEIDPQDAKAYFDRGTEKYRLGQNAEAIDDYSRAITIDPQYVGVYVGRGAAKYNLGQHREAIDDYSRAITLNPQAAEAYFGRGTAKYNLGQHREAIEDYSHAITLNPQDAFAYYNRGFAKHSLGQYQAAIDDYNCVIMINPQDIDAYFRRGAARHSLGQHQAAIDDYNFVIMINPQAAEAYVGRGTAKYNLGQHQAAIDDCNFAITLNPQATDAYNNRGLAKCSLGRDREAIDDYNFAITLNPQYAVAYYNRGLSKYNLGQSQAAIPDFIKATELFDRENQMVEYKRAIDIINFLNTRLK